MGVDFKKVVKEKKELKQLAEAVIGSVDLASHPEWRTKKKVISWVRKLRQEW